MSGVAVSSETLTIAQAQHDVRTVYARGVPGQAVASVLWLLAGLAADVVGPGAGMVTLLVGGTMILPVTMLVLRAAGRPSSLPRGHPMAALATQVAFTVPLGLLVALGAAAHRADWFFPAALVVVGAHYLPFAFLYGTRRFLVLAAALVGAGLALVLVAPDAFSAGAWVGGVVLGVGAASLARAP